MQASSITCDRLFIYRMQYDKCPPRRLEFEIDIDNYFSPDVINLAEVLKENSCVRSLKFKLLVCSSKSGALILLLLEVIAETTFKQLHFFELRFREIEERHIRILERWHCPLQSISIGVFTTTDIFPAIVALTGSKTSSLKRLELHVKRSIYRQENFSAKTPNNCFADVEFLCFCV